VQLVEQQAKFDTDYIMNKDSLRSIIDNGKILDTPINDHDLHLVVSYMQSQKMCTQGRDTLKFASSKAKTAKTKLEVTQADHCILEVKQTITKVTQQITEIDAQILRCVV
jgi:hypothetical protein